MRSVEALGVALLLCIIAFAGCLEPAAAPDDASLDIGALVDPSPIFARVRAEMEGVPCTIGASQVSLTTTTENIKSLVDNPLNEMGPTHSRGEFDLHGDLILETFYNNKGFSLVDISDPLDPKQVGFLVDPTASLPARGSASTLDAKFSHDGSAVFLAYSDSVGVADITDPAAPKLVQTMPNPVGYRGQAHMIYDARIGDAEYLFVFPSISGEHVVVHKVTGSGAETRLSYVTTYQVVTPTNPTRQPVAPHDGYVVYDEVAGHHLLYLANSFHGVQVIDVDDPANPRTLATIAANADGSATGYAPSFYHTIQAGWIDGRRIIVTSAEVGYNTLKVFDATDFSNVKFIGQWVFDDQNPTNMQHNLQIVDGILFEAHYGQGLFGFDLRAYLQGPTPDVPVAFHYQPPGGGSLWDVVVRKGVAYASDTSQGLHVLGYGCFTPGDLALDSDG